MTLRYVLTMNYKDPQSEHDCLIQTVASIFEDYTMESALQRIMWKDLGCGNEK